MSVASTAWGVSLRAIEQMQWNAVASTAWKLHAIKQMQSRERGVPDIDFRTVQHVLHAQIR